MPITNSDLIELRSKNKTVLLLDKPLKQELKDIITALGKDHPLKTLKLSNIEPENIKYVADILAKTPHLLSMEVSQSSGVNDKEIKGIFDKIQEVISGQLNSSETLIFTISLKNNAITDDGAAYIFKALPKLLVKFNRTQILTQIDLSGNKISQSLLTSIEDTLRLHHKNRSAAFANNPNTAELYLKYGNPQAKSALNQSNVNDNNAAAQTTQSEAANTPVSTASELTQSQTNQTNNDSAALDGAQEETLDETKSVGSGNQVNDQLIQSNLPSRTMSNASEQSVATVNTQAIVDASLEPNQVSRHIPTGMENTVSKNPYILNINISPNNHSVQYISHEKIAPEQVVEIQKILASSNVQMVQTNNQSSQSQIISTHSTKGVTPMPTTQSTDQTSTNNNNTQAVATTAESVLQPNGPQPAHLNTSYNKLPVTHQFTSVPYTIMQSEDKELQKLLKLKPTQSETMIEFNQVYTLPINRFYSTLFRNASLDSSEIDNSLIDENYNSKVELIDMRPLRWYRQYRFILNEIEEANFDYVNAEKKVAELRSLLNNANSNINDNLLQENFIKARNQLKVYANAIENLEASRKIILREMKADGYVIEKNENYKTGVKLDYTFTIIKYVRDSSNYVTIKFDKTALLGNSTEENKKWQEYKKALDDKLSLGKEPGLQSLTLRSQYTTEGNRLASIDHCRKLKAELKESNAAVAKQQNQKKLLEDQLSQANSQVTDATTVTPEYVEKIKQQIQVYEKDIATINASQIVPRRLNLIKKYSPDNNPVNLPFSTDVSLAFDTTGNKNWEYIAKQLNDIATDKGAFELAKKQIDNECDQLGKTQIATYVKEIEENLKPQQQTIEKILTQRAELQPKINACDCKIQELLSDQERLFKNALHEERWNFLNRWNDPSQNGVGPLKRVAFEPDVDPLTSFIASLSEQQNIGAVMLDLYKFNLTADGLYNQYGQSLADFMAESYGPHVVVILPYIDQSGMVSEEMFQVVHGPKPSFTKSPLPTVKFVETHVLNVGWKGYALGELRHAFNLFPGERKKVVIEKKTKLTTTLSMSKTSSEETKRNATSSFEDNLQNELSTAENVSNSEEQKRQQTQSQNNTQKSGAEYMAEQSRQASQSSESSWNVQAKAEAGWGWGSAEVSGGKSGKKSNSSTTNSGAKSSVSQNKESALSVGLTNEGQNLNKQSKDTTSKNVQNSIRKVATETSSNNKVEVSSSSSEQYESSTENKETMEVENQNVGRTVNYNFYQLQNIYGTTAKLKDVKIFINTGRELIAGTGICDIRVYELEEFNQIFSSFDSSNFSAALASLIVRKGLQQYSKLVSSNRSSNDSLRIKRDNVDEEAYASLEQAVLLAYHTLSLNDKAEANATKTAKKESSDKNENNNNASTTSAIDFDSVKTALNSLKEITFEFNECTLMEESTFTINAPAYHVDAQLGCMPATEHYLEERRVLEIEKQKIELERARAEIRHLDAKTQAGHFSSEYYGRFFQTGRGNKPAINNTANNERFDAATHQNDLIDTIPTLTNK